jgi:hypothetical protein
MTISEVALLITAFATFATSVAGLIRSCQSYRLLKQREARENKEC